MGVGHYGLGWGWWAVLGLWWLVQLAWRWLLVPSWRLAVWGFRRVRKHWANVRADKEAARAAMTGGATRPKAEEAE